VRIDFRTIFPIWYKISVRFVLRICFASAFSVRPRGTCESSQCQKIDGCWESAVYGSRPPIASKPDSSPSERPDLNNITSQPWSEATWPCTTSAGAYLRFLTIFLLEKTRQSTRSGGRGQVASDHGWLVVLSRPVHSGGHKLGFETIRGREH